MDGYDPYNFYGMGSSADPYNFYSTTAYSTQFAPTATSPYGDTMVGPGNADPQASYYQNDDPFYTPSGEATAYRRSPSQVPGTSGAPPETPSATPGGVSSGRGTGIPNAYPTNPLSFFGNLAGGGRAQPQSPQDQRRMLSMATLGMNMLGPPPNPFAPRQQPQRPQMMGMDYNTMLRLFGALPQMQYGGRPTGPTVVGERGPEIFTPDVPGTISPTQSSGLPPGMNALPAGLANRSPPGWVNAAWTNPGWRGGEFGGQDDQGQDNQGQDNQGQGDWANFGLPTPGTVPLGRMSNRLGML